VKLSDTHGWTPDTALERLALKGQDLSSYQAFWDRSAEVDAIRAIADQDSDESFTSSGVEDAEGIRPLLPSDGVFLEIGCGIGRVLQHMASMCREVHGVDISAEMIKRGRQRLRYLSNVHFHEGNGYDLEPFQSNSVDVVYCAFVFQHMPKTSVFNYLQEIYRVLKPEGVIRFQVPNLLQHEQFESFKHFAEPHFVHHPYPMHFYTPAEVIQLTTRAGFWVEELTDDIMVRARKRKHAGVALDIAGGDDLVDLKARNRQLQQSNNQLLQRLDRVLGNPMVRTAIAVRDRLRGLSAVAPRVR
jgi:ubiquinone/menaquinone biosynthesis C-methylase UbiE